MLCPKDLDSEKQSETAKKVLKLSLSDKYEAAVDRLVAKGAKGASKIADKVDRDRKILKYISTSQNVKDVAAIVNAHRNDNVNMEREAANLFDFIQNEVSKEDGVTLTRALGGDIEGVPKHLEALYDRFRTLIDANAKTLVEVGALAEENAMKNYLKRYYKQYLKEHKKSTLAMSKLHKRKDLTLDERIELGLVENAGFVVANTLLEQKKQIAKMRMLKEFADTFAVEEKIDGYVLVPTEVLGEKHYWITENGKKVKKENTGGVTKWGALSGKYVPKDVYMELKLSGQVADAISFLDKNPLTAFVDHIKVNVTVKNPGTHVYNVASNMQVAYMNGDLGALKEIFTMSKEKRTALFDLAKKNGLENELHEYEKVHQHLTQAIKEDKKDNWIKVVFKNLYMTEDSYAGKKIRKAYALEDEIFKVANFYKRMKKLEATDEKSVKKAMDEAMADYVDYSTPLPPLVRRLDKNGLFPFVHYVWKSTPRIALIIAKNPTKFLALQAGLYGMGASSLWGDNDDDYAKPVWAKESGFAGLTKYLPTNLFAAKQWVHTYDDNYINLGRSLPGMRLGGLSVDLGFIGAFSSLIQGRDPLHKSKIYKDSDSTPVAIAKTLIKTSQNYLPSLTLGRYGQQWISIAAGNPPKNHYGKDLTIEESAQRISGVRKFNGSKEITNSMKDVMKQWKYDNISNEEMQDKLKKITAYAKSAGIKVDRKKVSAALRKTKKAKSKIKKDWAYSANKFVNEWF